MCLNWFVIQICRVIYDCRILDGLSNPHDAKDRQATPKGSLEKAVPWDIQCQSRATHSNGRIYAYKSNNGLQLNGARVVLEDKNACSNCLQYILHDRTIRLFSPKRHNSTTQLWRLSLLNILGTRKQFCQPSFAATQN